MDVDAGSVGDRPFGFRILGPADEPPDRLRRRVQALVTLAIVCANVVGALAVIALNVWVIPHPGLLDTPRRTAAIVLTPVYLVGAVAIGAWLGTRQQLARLRWITEERDPSPDEQRAALVAPAELLVVQLVLWGSAAVLFGALGVGVGGRVVLRTVVTVVLGGIVTCGYAYLLSETAFRPVAARALAVPANVSSTPGLAVRTLSVWVVGTGAPALGLMILAVVVLVDEDVSASSLARSVLGLGAVTIAAGLVLLALATRAIRDPLAALTSALGRVEQGDLDGHIVVYDGTEIGRVQAAFNRMVRGLREREELRDLFSRHVGDDVARAALERGPHLGGELCEATALFVDIIGSTTLGERRAPEEVVASLNRFFEAVVSAVDPHGGWVNKFEGDAALCVFGPPNGLADHAGSALRAVRDLRHGLDDLFETDGLRAGIGVASGTVVAGNVGARHRFEYTVIGDPVNTAARLSELAKEHHGGALVAGATMEGADDHERAQWRPAGEVTVRGRTTSTAIYEPR